MVSLRNFEPTARTFPRATLAPLDKALVMMIKAGRHTLPQLCRSVSIRMIIAIHQPAIRDDAMRDLVERQVRRLAADGWIREDKPGRWHVQDRPAEIATQCARRVIATHERIGGGAQC